MKKRRYSEVLKDLEVIVEKMNKGEIPIDHLGESVKTASEMISYLRQNLKATEAEITAILKGLEGEAAPPADETEP
jgi:exodeoxyribonuclease VII small subunit